MQRKLIKTDLVTCPAATGKVLVVWVAVEPDDFIMAMDYDICHMEEANEWYYDWRGNLSPRYTDEQSCIDAAIDHARRPIGIARGELISTKVAAERLNVDPSRIRQFVMQGRLTPVKKTARDSLFYEGDIERFRRERGG